jgi:hypothetical protein
MDMEYVVVTVFIDDRPFFHGTEPHAMIDPIWIECFAINEEPEILPMEWSLGFRVICRES